MKSRKFTTLDGESHKMPRGLISGAKAHKPLQDSRRLRASEHIGYARDTGNIVQQIIHEGRDKVAGVWSKAPRSAKIGGGVVAGGAATGLALMGLLSPHNANVTAEDILSGEYSMDTSNSLVTDGDGAPSLLSYLDPELANEAQVLRVSLATQLPDNFHSGRQIGNHLDDVEMHARSHTTRIETYTTTSCSGSGSNYHCTTQTHTRTVTDHHYYDYKLDIEKDFRPINANQEAAVRDYFRDFTAATGIRVEVVRDAQDADITIGNFYNEPDSYRGSLDYVEPGMQASLPPSASGFKQGFIVLNEMEGNLNGVLEALPHSLGFADGQMNIKVLRDKLTEAGRAVPRLNTGDDLYDLSVTLNDSGDLLPDNVIFDQGGVNTLLGTEENDIIFSEATYCGRTGTPTRWVTNVFGDGDKYCIADGEFSVVQSGKGDDIIVVPREGNQVIEPGEGNDRVMIFTPEIGDLTILSERSGEDKDSKDKLILSEELIRRNHVEVAVDGDDLVLSFHAPSDRLLGTIHLRKQLVDDGIQELQIVDQEGDVIWEHDVNGVNTVADWENDVVRPLEAKMEERMLDDLKKDAKEEQEGAAARIESERSNSRQNGPVR